MCFRNQVSNVASLVIGAIAVVIALLSITHEHNRDLVQLKEDIDKIFVKYKNNPNALQVKEANFKLETYVNKIVNQRLASLHDNVATSKERKTTAGEETKKICQTKSNYASAKSGATIHEIKAVVLTDEGLWEKLLSAIIEVNSPMRMLTASMVPGDCFKFGGTNAEITIKLAEEIYVGAVEIAHIPKELSKDGKTDDAPKHFKIYGLRGKQQVFLGAFKYNNWPGNLAQVYKIKEIGKYQYLRFICYTNHGNLESTCIYKIGIYEA